MKKILFITQMYISRVLLATLLTYIYVSNSSPSGEGMLEKNSPAFFSHELDAIEEMDDQGESSYQDHREANQE